MPYTATNDLNDLVETSPPATGTVAADLGPAELETRRTFKAVIMNQHNSDGTHKTLPGAAITAGSIPTGSFAAGAIATADLADKAVTAAKMADATITSTQVAVGGLVNASLADKTVLAAKLGSAADAKILVSNGSGGWAEHTPSGAVTMTNAGVFSLVTATINQAIAIFQDILSSGVNGGTFTAGAWQKRTLNSTLIDSSMLFNLSSSVLTWSTPGTYYIKASAIANGVDLHQIRLYDPINTVQLAIGSPAFALSGGSPGMTTAELEAVITVAPGVTQKLQLEHQCQTTLASSGFGLSSGFTSANNVFASITIIKLA